jgi:hypothetical protein
MNKISNKLRKLRTFLKTLSASATIKKFVKHENCKNLRWASPFHHSTRGLAEVMNKRGFSGKCCDDQ